MILTGIPLQTLQAAQLADSILKDIYHQGILKANG